MHDSKHRVPRIGVPWRTSSEQRAQNRGRYEPYLAAIRDAGGAPVEILLSLPVGELQHIAETLDGVVLPGSPADVDPSRYGTTRHKLTADADADRERTDDVLLDKALSAGKPVLAICYGTQLLNVHLGGSLIQDIASELHSEIDHERKHGNADTFHPVILQANNGDKIADVAAQADTSENVRPDAQNAQQSRQFRVNSSHHQSIAEPGKGLRITGVAPDGVVEAVEWNAGPAWIVGVQWHPERMRGDAFADALFQRLIQEARISMDGS